MSCRQWIVNDGAPWAENVKFKGFVHNSTLSSGFSLVSIIRWKLVIKLAELRQS